MIINNDSKRQLVKRVFTDAAAKYELMNDLMSLGLQNWWRRAAMATISPDRRFLLDIAGGKGDIATRFLAKKRERRAIVADPSAAMIKYWGGEKITADAENLPFDDCSFDVATMAFGLRNIVDKPRALAEAFRVLEPHGQFVCLELGKPRLFRRAFRFYARKALPMIAKLVGSEPSAYRYLGKSVLEFESPAQVCRMMANVGFVGIRTRLFHSGVACIYSGHKP